LNKYCGDPVVHYTAIATSIIVNGTPLLPFERRNNKKKLYVIIDTGVTGMVISETLWNLRYNIARTNHDRSLWNTVQINFNGGSTTGSSTCTNHIANNNHNELLNRKNPTTTTISDSTCSIIQLNAIKPITTPLLGDKPWPKFKNAYLIVAGLSFLTGNRLTFEIDTKRLWID
jgi:hypothetical protein